GLDFRAIGRPSFRRDSVAYSHLCFGRGRAENRKGGRNVRIACDRTWEGRRNSALSEVGTKRISVAAGTIARSLVELYRARDASLILGLSLLISPSCPKSY